MDIEAAITGLKALKQPCRVTIYNNNTYVVKAIAGGWPLKWRAGNWTDGEKKTTPHSDLWEELLSLCSAHEVTFVYRRLDGHDRAHARFDLLARPATKSCEMARQVAANSDAWVPSNQA
jgi:ribonuclease HI